MGNPSYYFGVEVEMIAKPKMNLRDPKNGFQMLLDMLEDHGAIGHWKVERDGSLRPGPGELAIECVSPVLSSAGGWRGEIQTFWDAQQQYFEKPKESHMCGGHVHVTPGPDKTWSLPQLKDFALGVLILEPMVVHLLTQSRRGNPYCQPNRANNAYASEPMGAVRDAQSKASVVSIMQNRRYVLWNFANITGSLGTIEFRGGRGFRDAEKTKWWIVFTVAFAHLTQLLQYYRLPARGVEPYRMKDFDDFYRKIGGCATECGMSHILPSDYRYLSEHTNPRDEALDQLLTSVFGSPEEMGRQLGFSHY